MKTFKIQKIKNTKRQSQIQFEVQRDKCVAVHTHHQQTLRNLMNLSFCVNNMKVLMSQKSIETKMELSMLRQKYELLEKQRDILKQGNNNLVSQFLFNSHRQQLNRLQRQVKQRAQENTELKKIIRQLQEMVKSVMDSEKQGSNKDSSNKYQSSRRFSIRVENERNITVDKQSSIGYELKVQLKDLIDNYKKLMKGGRLFKSSFNNNNKKSIEKNEKTMKFCQSQIITPSYQHQSYQQKEQITHSLNTKINQLSQQNTQLKQKIQQLTLELINNNNKSLMQQKQKHPTSNPIVYLNDYVIPMSTSQSHTEEMQKSIIYDKLSSSQLSSSFIMQQSIITQSFDKRINKLQKTNSILQKDFQLSKQKNKTLNRQYSKLKLDFLKIDQDKRRLEQLHQRKIISLNDKIQTLNKKIKDLQLLNDKVKSQKNKQKQSNKNIISQHQSKIIQLQQKIQKNNIQMSHLKQKLQLSKKQQQKQHTHAKQLQIERQKSKQLQKQLQQRTINFQKSLKNYQTIIDDMRRLNHSANKEKENNNKTQRENKSRSRSRQSSSVNKTKSSLTSQFISPSQASLLMTLRQQISLLQSTITTQNERYNILQNSNKELRLRLIRMIDNEERLRKELINERIKTRTNKSISLSSKYSHKSKSVIKRGFNNMNSNNDMENDNSQYNDDDGEQYQSGSESRLDQLKIKDSNIIPNVVISTTDRNSQSYIHPSYTSRTLKQSSSSRQFKSQSVISANNNNNKDIIKNDDKKINMNSSNTNQNNSQMKMLRQRRFDPKETLVSKKKLPSTDFVQNKQSQFNINDAQDKPQSPVESFKHLIDNKDDKQNSSKKVLNKKLFEGQTYEPTYGRSSVEKNKLKTQQHQSPVSSSPKYVYQPPKPKSISPKPINEIGSSKYNQIHIPTSQPPTDNKEISFEISQSQSNLSKGDRIIELLSINNQTKADQSPYVNPFGYNSTNTKPTLVKQEPASVGKFTQMQIEVKQRQGSNIVMSGKPQQQTKSSAEVRFARKS